MPELNGKFKSNPNTPIIWYIMKLFRGGEELTPPPNRILIYAPEFGKNENKKQTFKPSSKIE